MRVPFPSVAFGPATASQPVRFVHGSRHLDLCVDDGAAAAVEEGSLPPNEFGPFGANSALQTVHGVPLPIYRGFQLLA